MTTQSMQPTKNMKNLKLINYKGKDYSDAVIIDGSILLQSLEQDVIFEGAYNTIIENLKNEWWNQGAYGSQRAYIQEYETASILEWIKDHEGQVIVHANN